MRTKRMFAMMMAVIMIITSFPAKPAFAGDVSGGEEEYEIPATTGGGTGLTLDLQGGEMTYFDPDLVEDVTVTEYYLDEPTDNLNIYNSLTKEGYWFTGWYNEAGEYISLYMSSVDYTDDYYRDILASVPAAGSTIYAGWEDACVLDANGGGIRGYDDVEFYSTMLMARQTDNLDCYVLEKEGYWFTGWYDRADTETANYLSSYDVSGQNAEEYRYHLKKTAEAGTTMYAGWEPACVLDFNGGVWYDSELDKDQSSTILRNRTTWLQNYAPTRKNYWFTGWYADKDCTVKLSYESTPDELKSSPVGGTTIYAGWTQDCYNITFKLGNKATYTGWMADKTTDTVTVKHPKGSLVNASYVISDSQVTFWDKHYSLEGWSLEENGTKIDFDTYVPEGDVTFYAIYDNTNAIITFNANGGYMYRDYYNNSLKETDSDRIVKNYCYYIPSTIPENTDARKAFAGWYLDEDCKESVIKYADSSMEYYADADAIADYFIETKEVDITLYAKWVDSNKVLTLDSNGGFFYDYDTDNKIEMEKAFGASEGNSIDVNVTNPKNRDLHKKFVGWYSKKTGGTLMAMPEEDCDYTEISLTLTEDVTWYARWEDAYPVVTFDAGEGIVHIYDPQINTWVDNRRYRQNVEDGRVSYPPAYCYIDDPHKVFDGWYIGYTRIDDIYEYVFTEDITVTAKYTECYSVTLNYSGGGYLSYDDDGNESYQSENYVVKVKKKATLGETGSVPEPIYNKKPMTFTGWFLSTDTAQSNTVNIDEFVPEEDTELIASWITDHKVTFDAGQGIFKGDEESEKVFYVPHGYTMPENDFPEDPYSILSGVCFDGWYDQDTKYDRYQILNRTVTDDVTYKAEYSDMVSVTFDANGGYLVSDVSNDDGTYTAQVVKGAPIGKMAPTAHSYDDDHRVFSGWYKDPECNGAPVDIYADAMESSLKLYAGWDDCYKISFHTNFVGATFENGSDTFVVKVIKGQPLRYGDEDTAFLYEMPRITETNGGLIIPGWNTRSDLKGDCYYFDANDYRVTSGTEGTTSYFNDMYGFIPTEDMDLYARIVKEKVTIKFNANGDHFDEYTREYGYQDQSLTEPYPSKLNAAGTVWTVTVPKGIKLSQVGTPYLFSFDKKAGYDYEWAYTDAKCKNAYSWDKPITSNITLYCKWTRMSGNSGDNQQTVTFHAGEGSYSSDDIRDKTKSYEYTPGDGIKYYIDIPTTADSTKVFMGWYTDAQLTKPYPEELQTMECEYDGFVSYVLFPETVTDLYAAYGEAYRVIFDANGGYFDDSYHRTQNPDKIMREKTWDSQKLYPGCSVVISEFTKRVRRDDTKVFAGWYTDPECTNKAVTYALDGCFEYYKPASSTRLYAKWVDYEKPDCFWIGSAGEEYQEFNINIGEKITIPVLSDYDLENCDIHWFIESYGTGENNVSNYNPVKLYSDGTVLGCAEGKCSIYAEVNGVRSKSTLTVNVSNILINSDIKICDNDGNYAPESLNLYSGDEVDLFGKIMPEESAEDLLPHLYWESSDPDVVKIVHDKNGRKIKIIAGDEGDADITATLGGISSVMHISVVDPVELTVKSLVMTALEDASAEITAVCPDNIMDTQITASAYEGDTPSDLVEISYHSANGASGEEARSYFNYVVEPSSHGLGIDEDHELVIVIKVSIADKEYEDRCIISLNSVKRVEPVKANIESGKMVDAGTKLLLSTDTPDAEIYYSFDDNHPILDENGEPGPDTYKYSDAISINERIKINAIAVKKGRRTSKEQSFEYSCDEWGSAGKYKDIFRNDPSLVPDGVWFVLDGTVFAPTVAGIGGSLNSTYDGSPKTIENVEVFYGTTLLVENWHYTIKYSNNVKAAKAIAVNKKKKSIAPTITITGKGELFTGSRSFHFSINKADINTAKVTSETEIYVTPGKKVSLTKTKPVVEFNGKKLSEGKDYVLKYYEGSVVGENPVSNPSKVMLKDPGMVYTVEVLAKAGSNFEGCLHQLITIKTVSSSEKPIISFNIGTDKKKAIKVSFDEDVSINAEMLFDNTDGKTPYGYVYAKNPKDALTYGTDFKVEMDDSDHLSVGKHYFNIVGLGNYKGNKEGFYEITGKDISKVKIAGLKTTVPYTARKLTFEKIVDTNDKISKANNWEGITLYTTSKVKKKTVYNVLEEDKDYKIEFENNRKYMGNVTIKITGLGQYYGTLRKTVKIVEFKISSDTVFIEYGDATYSKAGAKPKVYITTSFGAVLMEGRDFTVSYKNNNKVVDDYLKLKKNKRPTIVIKGIGPCSGTLSNTYFNIKKADVKDTLTLSAPDVFYNSKGGDGYMLVKPILYDSGKKVTVGKNKDIAPIPASAYSYYYAEDTYVDDGNVLRYAGEKIGGGDKLPAGTLIRAVVSVTVTKSSPYYVSDKDGSCELETTYRYVGEGMDISRMTARIKSGVSYTAPIQSRNVPVNEVIPVKSTDIEVFYKPTKKGAAVYLDPSDYEIVSVTNNKFVGTATVVIRGKNSYGGTKSFTFKIKKTGF